MQGNERVKEKKRVGFTQGKGQKKKRQNKENKKKEENGEERTGKKDEEKRRISSSLLKHRSQAKSEHCSQLVNSLV